MTYLLDAHVIIENPGSRLVVSAWEISTKHRLGKLPEADALLGAYSKRSPGMEPS